MELTKRQTSMTKGVAILLMLLLHLFCTREYNKLFTPIIMIGETPLIYYVGLFGDCCVAIYCFCSGYGLMRLYKENPEEYNKKNLVRICKMYINFWIILFLFVIVLGYITGNFDKYFVNLKVFILNFTAISVTYNGAWWFLTTYIILVILSKSINKIIEKYNAILILGISFMIYFICYIEYWHKIIVFDGDILNWAVKQITLLGTSQLAYLVGGIFAHKKIYSQIYKIFFKVKFKNIISITLIILLVVFHSFIQTAFISSFTGICFIIVFNLIEKPKFLNDLLYYFSQHSTNIWLIHMFFYMTYFKDLIFLAKYPILIFLWLIVLCLISSYVVKFIYNTIVKKLDLNFLSIYL